MNPDYTIDPKYTQTETEKPQMQTKREPDNASPKGSPGRLHLLADTVLTGWEQKPDPWYAEFAEWRESILGERPRKEGGKRGYENWNLVSLGMVLAWGYFAQHLAEEAEELAREQWHPQLDQGYAEPPAEKPQEQLVLPYTDREVSKPTFAVLDANGQPVVQGYK